MTTESTAGEHVVRALYQRELDAWNARDAAAMAALYAADGSLVGFDGGQVEGRAQIEAHLAPIFADHPTAAYTGIVREARFLAPDVALVRAVAGMTPPGSTTIKPELNAIQALVAVRRDGQWQIAHYQNTPAAFHGRPEASQALTEELQRARDAATSNDGR